MIQRQLLIGFINHFSYISLFISSFMCSRVFFVFKVNLTYWNLDCSLLQMQMNELKKRKRKITNEDFKMLEEILEFENNLNSTRSSVFDSVFFDYFY